MRQAVTSRRRPVKAKYCSRHGRDAAWCLAGRKLDKTFVGVAVAVALLVVAAMWSHSALILSLIGVWRSSNDYSAGQLVPIVAAVLVWRERKALGNLELRPCWLPGFGLILLGEALRFYGFFTYRFSAERYALVVTIAGLVLLVAGWRVFRRLSWILLFLFLMFPLPGRIHNAVSDPLQRLATNGAVFLLEAFGVLVTQQGNVIILNNSIYVTIAEACSGLRMLTAFIMVAAFIAYWVMRPRWHKGIVLASSIPVAVVCNIIRIFVTAMIMLYVSEEIGKKFFHDFAGLVMMPAAVSIIFGEIWLLDKIVEPQEPAKPKTRSSVVARSVRRAAERSARA